MCIGNTIGNQSWVYSVRLDIASWDTKIILKANTCKGDNLIIGNFSRVTVFPTHGFRLFFPSTNCNIKSTLTSLNFITSSMAWRRKSQKVIYDSILLLIFRVFAFLPNHVVQSLNINSNHNFLKRNFHLTIFQHNLNQYLDLVNSPQFPNKNREKWVIDIFWSFGNPLYLRTCVQYSNKELYFEIQKKRLYI